MEENAMEVIEAKYGIKGPAIVLKLLCKIYKEGYFIRWDEEQCLIFANKAGREVQAAEVQGIIEILFIKGILDRNSYLENGILTSESIQKVWLEATKRRKRELSELPYLIVKPEKENGKPDAPSTPQETQRPELFKEEKIPVNPKNVVHHVAVDAKNACNSGQSKVKESKAKENKKFFFGQIKKGARSSEYELAIQWLVDCGLVYKVNRVNEPNMPLKAYKSMNAYKLFLLDVGLLGALSELEAESILDGNDIFVEFKGALTEQYVLQQLISDTRYTPYYFGTEKATFEQDFLVQRGKDIVPIEVKAGDNIRSQSLKAYCDKYHPNKAVRFSTLKYIDQGWMENIPLYAVCNL